MYAEKNIRPYNWAEEDGFPKEEVKPSSFSKEARIVETRKWITIATSEGALDHFVYGRPVDNETARMIARRIAEKLNKGVFKNHEDALTYLYEEIDRYETEGVCYTVMERLLDEDVVAKIDKLHALQNSEVYLSYMASQGKDKEFAVTMLADLRQMLRIEEVSPDDIDREGVYEVMLEAHLPSDVRGVIDTIDGLVTEIPDKRSALEEVKYKLIRGQLPLDQALLTIDSIVGKVE